MSEREETQKMQFAKLLRDVADAVIEDNFQWLETLGDELRRNVAASGAPKNADQDRRPKIVKQAADVIHWAKLLLRTGSLSASVVDKDESAE